MSRSEQRSIMARRYMGLSALMLAIVLGGGVALLPAPAGVRPAAVHAQPADDPALLRELAERLLGAGTPSPPPPSPAGGTLRARLFPGALPPTLPLDLPLPPGSRLVGSAVAPSLAGGPDFAHAETIEVVLDAPGTPDEIVAFYEGALTERGWTAARDQGPEPGGFVPERLGGFQPSSIPSIVFFCPGAAGGWLALVVTPAPGGLTDVRVHLETGFPGPCGGPGGPMRLPPGAELLPPLNAPPGVPVLPGGMGGGPGLWTAVAVALTGRSAAELEAHYARQLAAAGWTRLDGGVVGPLAWSTWTVPGAGEWQGFLAVREAPGPDRRVLHVEVVSGSMVLPGFGPVP